MLSQSRTDRRRALYLRLQGGGRPPKRSEGGRVGVSLALISPAKTPTRLPFLASLEMTIDLPLSGGGIHAARGR
jgi:hypothetical protein